ncbi:hypothetical protein BKA70DRAFT_1280349 [Coprinopsis sp. MPI-PUGE-AT-0042]|nr:hypothetical protein BKA70DRAFT_1280349 [Coprinopsis sp. MPI-PUGE-AT-0042]
MPVTLQTTTSFPSRGRSRSRLDLTKIESEMHGTASVPSAPVQIPASRRPAPSVVVSNHGNPGFGLTPDAVFDMSPVTSEFGSSPSSQTDRSKFLYNFPSLPRHQPFSGPRRVPSRYGAHSPSPPNPSEDRSAEVASRYRVADPLAPRQASRSPYLCKGSNVLDEYDLSPGGMSPDSYSPMKENHTSLGSIHALLFLPALMGEDGPSSGGKKSSREDAAGSCSYSHVDPGVFELESRYPSRLNMGPSMQ